MVAKPSALIAFLLFCFHQTCAQVDNDVNFFKAPSSSSPAEDYAEDALWVLNSERTVSWTTNITEEYSISLVWQNTTGNVGNWIQTIYTAGGTAVGDQAFQWPVSTYDGNSQVPGVYYLILQSVETSSLKFTSHYFNISAATTSASTSSSVTSVSTSGTTISTATSSTAVSSVTSSSITTTSIATPTSTVPTLSSSVVSLTTPTVANSTPHSTDSSLVLPVGLGVGLGLGVPLVLFVGIWIGLKALGRRSSASQLNSSSDLKSSFSPFPEEQSMGPPLYPGYTAPVEAGSRTPYLVEADGRASPSELQ